MLVPYVDTSNVYAADTERDTGEKVTITRNRTKTLRRSTSIDKFSNERCNRVPLSPLRPTLCNSTDAAARVCCRRAITMAGSV